MANIKLQNPMYVPRWITRQLHNPADFCIEVNSQVVNLQCVNFKPCPSNLSLGKRKTPMVTRLPNK